MIAALLLKILTSKVVPLVFPPLIAAARKYLIAKLPPALIPLALTLGGALVNTAATALGVDGMPADLSMLGAAAWDGALLGLATTGVHQAWTRGAEWLKARKP